MHSCLRWTHLRALRAGVNRADRSGDPLRLRQTQESFETGSKYHLVVDRNGIPLAIRLSAANAHDSTQLLPLVDAIPPIIGPRGRPGRPRKRPAKLHADKAYDSSRPAPCPADSRHHATGCAPRDRLQRATGTIPLGGGAELRLAARLSPPRRPLRAAGPPAAGPAAPGLCADLSYGSSPTDDVGECPRSSRM